MTSLSGGMHEADAESFVERNSLGFDNVVYEKETQKELQVGGFPTVLALSGGRVVWRGHPDHVTRLFVAGLIRGDLIDALPRVLMRRDSR